MQHCGTSMRWFYAHATCAGAQRTHEAEAGLPCAGRAKLHEQAVWGKAALRQGVAVLFAWRHVLTSCMRPDAQRELTAEEERRRKQQDAAVLGQARLEALYAKSVQGKAPATGPAASHAPTPAQDLAVRALAGSHEAVYLMRCCRAVAVCTLVTGYAQGTAFFPWEDVGSPGMGRT